MEPDSESDPPSGCRDSDSPESESPDGAKLDLPVPVGGAGVTVGVTGIQVAGQTLGTGRRVRGRRTDRSRLARDLRLSMRGSNLPVNFHHALCKSRATVRDRTDPTVMVTAQATTR